MLAKKVEDVTLMVESMFDERLITSEDLLPEIPMVAITIDAVYLMLSKWHVFGYTKTKHD